MTDRSKLDAYIAEIETAAYQRGRDDARAEFDGRMTSIREKFSAMLKTLNNVMGEDMLAWGQDLQAERASAGDAVREPREGSDQAKVLRTIREGDGLRGVDVVNKLAGVVEERTVRTALHRLKNREAIYQKDGKWYPSIPLFEKLKASQPVAD